MSRYWETPSFRRTQREWAQRLAESGFRDIETADGSEMHADTQARVDGYIPQHGSRVKKRRQEGAYEVTDLYRGAYARAREALSDEMVWRGLPPRARKFWALVTSLGFDVRPAGRIVGVSRRKAEGWRDEILRRIG